MKRCRKMVSVFLPIMFLASFLFSAPVLAVTTKALDINSSNIGDVVQQQINSGAQPAYGNTPTDARAIVAQVIKILLGMTGTICFVLIVMSGYWFLTSHGDSEQVDKAQTTVRNAVIGLIIVLAAYAITSLVSAKVPKLLNSPAPTAQEQTVNDYVKRCSGWCWPWE